VVASYPPGRLRYRYGDQAFCGATSRLILELCRGVRHGMTPDEALDALAGNSQRPTSIWTTDLLGFLGKGSAGMIRFGFLLTGVGMLFVLALVIGSLVLLNIMLGYLPPSLLIASLVLMTVVYLVGLRLVALVVASAGGEESVLDRLSRYLAHRMILDRARGFDLRQCAKRASPMVLAQHLRILQMLERGENDAATRAATLLASSPLHARRGGGLRAAVIVYGVLIGGIASFVIGKVLPKFGDIFTQLGAELPTTTQALLKLPSMADPHGVEILVILLFIGYAMLTRLAWHFQYLTAPFILALAAMAILALYGEEPIVALLPLLLGVLIYRSLPGIGERWTTVLANPWRLVELLPIKWRPGRWERIEFLSALREFDPATMPPSELSGALEGLALNLGGRARAEHFKRGAEAGKSLPDLLADPDAVPLRKRECALAALACRAGTLPAAAAVMFQDALEEEQAARTRRAIVMRYLLVLSVAFVVLIIANGLYQPLFNLPAFVGANP